jgi:hypothetical protein
MSLLLRGATVEQTFGALPYSDGRFSLKPGFRTNFTGADTP